jgi:hypothetical protein
VDSDSDPEEKGAWAGAAGQSWAHRKLGCTWGGVRAAGVLRDSRLSRARTDVKPTRTTTVMGIIAADT